MFCNGQQHTGPERSEDGTKRMVTEACSHGKCSHFQERNTQQVITEDEDMSSMKNVVAKATLCVHMYHVIKTGYTNASNPRDSTPPLRNTLGTTFLAGNWNLNDNVTSKIQPQLCDKDNQLFLLQPCLLYTSPSPRDATLSRMPSSA